MNKRLRRLQKFADARKPVIHWRGRSLTFPEAGALATGELHRKNFQEALDIYNLMLGRGAAHAEIFNNRGVALLELNRYSEALLSFDQAIALKPDHAEAHNNQGAVLQKLGCHGEALAKYSRALTLKPAYANALHNRGSLLKQMQRLEPALADYDAAIALNPNHLEACNNRGAVLQEMKLYDRALASFDLAIASNPKHVAALTNRGVVLVNKGDMREAERMFLRVLELEPHSPAAWFSLVNIRQYQNADNEDAKSIQALLNKPGLAPDDKEYLCFSLGKIYDDCRLYDRAFAYYRLANQVRNETVFYDADRVSHSTTELMEVFSQAFLAKPFEGASDSRLPLFIVGMPRSGTTLLSNILSQHPAIAAAGELATIPDLISEFLDPTEDGNHYPQSARQIDPAVATHLTAAYERRLRRDLVSDRAHVIDKNPLNFRHLGLIAMLFPQGRIIHCTRHPLDTGLSNYFQRFPSALAYSFDLRNIGHFHREYARLMEHWRQALPVHVIEVSYEEMVTNTEKTARRLLDCLGLAWDERCLSPHTNPAAVESASQWQVRKPVYRHSLERWRHYEKHLAPLKESLRPGGPGQL